MEKHLYISLPKLKSSEIQDIHFKINLLLFSVDDQTEKVDDKKSIRYWVKIHMTLKAFTLNLLHKELLNKFDDRTRACR